MAEGWGPTAGNAALTTVTNQYPHIKLHVGPPGAAGTANPATETARKQAAWNPAASGQRASSGALTWTSIQGSQDATHFTAWDDPTAGVFGYSGVVTANPYTAGDTLTIATGALTASVPLAS